MKPSRSPLARLPRTCRPNPGECESHALQSGATGHRPFGIFDTRLVSRQRTWAAREHETKVDRFCDSARTPAAVIKESSGAQDMIAQVEDVQSAIQKLCESNVLLPINGKLLSLGVAA